jgi:hypothetical protein
MSRRRLLALILPLLALGGCTYSVHQLYVGSLDPGVTYAGARWVEAESDEFVILGFEFGSDYVEAAYKKLESQCPGRLAQVTTEHLTAYKFLSYDQKLVLKGLCRG